MPFLFTERLSMLLKSVPALDVHLYICGNSTALNKSYELGSACRKETVTSKNVPHLCRYFCQVACSFDDMPQTSLGPTSSSFMQLHQTSGLPKEYPDRLDGVLRSSKTQHMFVHAVHPYMFDPFWLLHLPLAQGILCLLGL